MLTDQQLRTEFPLEEGLVYLNHAAVSPWPRRAAEAVSRFAQENLHQGARAYPTWLEMETRLRQRLARLINAPNVDDIALVKNTSEALSFVAHGLPWQPGDNVVITDEEFPSNRLVWESLRRYGVEVREAKLHSEAGPEAAIIAQLDERTRLLSVSSVQFASGLRLDLPTLGRACRERATLFCVDAIQSLGAIGFDVAEAGADFVAADGHKWMLGAEGLALFYCRAELRERLTLHEFGWHMVERMGEFEHRAWQPAASARRFECGSPNLLGGCVLEASLALLEEVGSTEIERRLLRRVEHLAALLRTLPGCELITDLTPGRYAGILTFRHMGVSPQQLYEALMAAGVVCAARGGGVRFSPHFYTREEDLVMAVERVERITN